MDANAHNSLHGPKFKVYYEIQLRADNLFLFFFFCVSPSLIRFSWQSPLLEMDREDHPPTPKGASIAAEASAGAPLPVHVETYIFSLGPCVNVLFMRLFSAHVY